MKRILLFAMCFTFTLTTLSAQEDNQVVFTGEGDGYSWEDDLNWRRGGDPNLPGIPEPYDDILIEFSQVYYNGLGSIPLNQEYGSLELGLGAHLTTQGDFRLSGDFIVDAQSTFESIVRDVDHVNNITCDGNYFFNGTMQIAFSGYVPQIGQEFLLVDGYQGSCSTPQSILINGDGYDVTLGAQCQFEGLSYVVTDLLYTTAYAWDGEAGDNYWSTEENWNHNDVPPDGATIIINLPEGDYVITEADFPTEVHTIYIGHNNTLEVSGDLLVEKFIYLSDYGTLRWTGGKIYSPDENQQSALISYGEIDIDGPGLKELDTNFNIWQFYGDINHYQGDLDINNGIIRMFNFNSYNIHGDNINIGYSSGDLHELTVSVVSKLKKTAGMGTSSINLSTFINYGEVISESGTLAFNEDVTVGEYEEYIDGELVEYIGTFSGSGSFGFPDNYVMDGVVAPGSSPGILTMVGDFTTSVDATFEIEIDGPNAGTQYDQVNVTNEAILEGKINVTLGYLPANDASFEIVTALDLSSCNFPSQINTSYNGTPYTFNVVCFNNSLFLNGPGVALSTNENILEEELALYPNPASSVLNVKSSLLSKGHWELINQLGQVVKGSAFESKALSINVKEIPTGVYFFKIEDENLKATTTKRIVISN